MPKASIADTRDNTRDRADKPRPPKRLRLEEICQVLVEQDALVQVDLTAGDLPAAIDAAQGVDPLADEGALLV